LKLTSSQEEFVMTIGELAAESDIPASTIRYWERIGVLPKSARVSGQRRYSPDAVDRLAVMRLAQACGFRLDEMRHLLHGFGPGVTPSRRWQELASRKQHEIDGQIARLKAMRKVVDRVLHCQCVELQDCGRLAASVMRSVSL
jgi:MerR family transcriptional regulator, redox-sensitive transcriptional activator SoxR